MNVRILTNVSDLSGVHKAGDEVEVEDARGAEYIKAGIAEEAGAPKANGPEAAMLGDTGERATHPRAHSRG